MEAQLKCSNCGAEISNLNMSWGRKQWLWIIPFMFLAFVAPFISNFMIKGGGNNFRSDLSIRDIESRYENGNIEILGTIENHGKIDWERIYVKAEFFNKNGKFLDVLTCGIPDNLAPGAVEHLRSQKRNSLNRVGKKPRI